jgi:thioredoxin-disulfide reductase
MYDLVVIGGGPAGITAGIYAARKKLNALLITKEFGGQVNKGHEITNYPGITMTMGVDLMKKFVEHLKSFDIEIKEGQNVREIEKADNEFKVVLDNGDKFETKSIIIASGKNPRPLKVPGEEKFAGKGVTYCSICDAPLFKEKDVAVIGGGNSGLDTALDLTKYANKIYVVEFADKLLGDESTQEKLRASGKVKMITNAATKEFKGDKLLETLVYEDRKTGKMQELKVQGAFVEIGYVPSSGFIKDLVEFNKAGEIVINPQDNSTKTPGVFAAGDVTDIPYKQIVIAAAEGAKAALSAYNYLTKKI